MGAIGSHGVGQPGSIPVQQQPPQQTYQKRPKKNLIKITDPNTGKEIDINEGTSATAAAAAVDSSNNSSGAGQGGGSNVAAAAAGTVAGTGKASIDSGAAGVGSSAAGGQVSEDVGATPASSADDKEVLTALFWLLQKSLDLVHIAYVRS